MSAHTPERVVAMRWYDDAIKECQRLRATNAELLAALREEETFAIFITSTLNSVAMPSGEHAVSRAFADIRGALSFRCAQRRAAIAKAEGK